MPEPDVASDMDMDGASSGPMEIALLHDLTRWREQLARSIARNNLALRSEQIATAVNQIIFRLLFLRIAEDRSLISAGTFRNIATEVDSYRILLHRTQALDDLFHDLFLPTHFTGPEPAGLMDHLVIEETVMQKIVGQLNAPDRRYDFANIRTEAIARAFGQYLRCTVRRSATHQAGIVDTHDETHSRSTRCPGDDVVEYLVRGTLNTAITNRSRREVLPLRIADPACGAGLMLLNAFSCLAETPGRNRPGFEERKQVLVESVHGVDANPHAVAITRLLLLFKLCEGEDARTLPGDFFMVTRAVLQNLCMTIRNGNALIGPDIVHDESRAFCPVRERYQLNTFEWRNGFPEIFAAGGFDGVISNPPDGPLDRREWIQQYFQQNYSAYDPAVDRSAYFVERGISLLRTGGALGYCMSDRWLRGREGTGLRSVLLRTQLEEIVDFVTIGKRTGPELCVLRLTNRPPSRSFTVTLADPGLSTNETPRVSGTLAEFIAARRFPVDQSSLDAGGWALRDTRREKILAKVRRSGTVLADYVMDQVFSGVTIAPDAPFVINETMKIQLIQEDPRCRQFIRPLLSGNEIQRYAAMRAQRFIIVIPCGWTISHPAARSSPWRWFRRRHPALARFLKQCCDIETKSPGEIWWERTAGPVSAIAKEPRILFPGDFKIPAFAYDEGRSVPDETVGIILSSREYLAGILNSRLLTFFFIHSHHAGYSGMYSWDDLRDLPIYTPDFEKSEDAFRHDRIVSLVRRISNLNREVHGIKAGADREMIAKKITATDKAIDAIVYDLYGLTAAEIAVVEARPTG